MDITRYIETSNKWLAANKPNVLPITLEQVEARLASNSSMLSIGADYKTVKGEKHGYLTGILYLAPHKITGFNTCPAAVTCIKSCLFTAGRGSFGSVTRARIVKTLAWLMDSKRFESHLSKDIKALERKAKRKDMLPAVRLNGTSDIAIERTFKGLLAEFSHVQFYDYTKLAHRYTKELPSNYDLTFSFDGVNITQSLEVLSKGGRVAVVFMGGLPNEFLGHKVFNGDNTDLRFLDKGGIVGLNAKGKAKKEDSIFIINTVTLVEEVA